VIIIQFLICFKYLNKIQENKENKNKKQLFLFLFYFYFYNAITTQSPHVIHHHIHKYYNF